VVSAVRFVTPVRRYIGTTSLDGRDEFVLNDVREDRRLDDHEVVAVLVGDGLADVLGGGE
jgi:hypothetical protein